MGLTNADIVPAAMWGKRAKTTTGNFSTDPGRMVYTGSLPRKLQEIFYRSIEGSMWEEVEHVIYSYSTPIAIKVRGKWLVPDVTYSRTTSAKHQIQLYRLDYDLIPWDATGEDVERILDGKMRYVKNWTGDKIGRYVAA